jgi:hypothetical protein
MHKVWGINGSLNVLAFFTDSTCVVCPNSRPHTAGRIVHAFEVHFNLLLMPRLMWGTDGPQAQAWTHTQAQVRLAIMIGFDSIQPND